MSALATAWVIARNPVAQAAAVALAVFAWNTWTRHDAARDALVAERGRSAVEAYETVAAASAARRKAESDAASADLVELCLLNSPGGERMRDECERDVAEHLRGDGAATVSSPARAVGGLGAGGGALPGGDAGDGRGAEVLAGAGGWWTIATWLALAAAAVGAGLYVRRRLEGVAHKHSGAVGGSDRAREAGGHRPLRGALKACVAAILGRAARARRGVRAAVVAAVAAMGLRRGADGAGDPDRPGRWRWGAVARRLRGVAGAIAGWAVAVVGLALFLIVTADVARDVIERRVAYVVREGVQPAGMP